MRELALSRGFYPVMAIGPDFQVGGKSKGEGKGKSKGKGKSQGPKGKNKGKGKGIKRTPFNRRPMPGLRQLQPSSLGATSSVNSTSGFDSLKSTMSGSISQHGPRFKRYRT